MTAEMEVMTGCNDPAKLRATLASVIESSDGWMQAYYRQTSRLLRAESALRDVIDGLSTQKGFERSIAAIKQTLEALKDEN